MVLRIKLFINVFILKICIICATHTSAESILHWRLDNMDKKIIIDSSGHGLNGKVTGGTIVGGKCGNAIEWSEEDGNAVYFPAESSVLNNLGGKITIEAWIYPKKSPSGTPPFYSGSIMGRLGNYSLRLSSKNKICAALALSNTKASMSRLWTHGLVSVSSIPLNQWTHVALVVDTSIGAAGLFVNGKLDNKISVPENSEFQTVSKDYPLFARGYTQSDEKFIGIIDEIKIHNDAFYPLIEGVFSKILFVPYDCNKGRKPEYLISAEITDKVYSLAFYLEHDGQKIKQMEIKKPNRWHEVVFDIGELPCGDYKAGVIAYRDDKIIEERSQEYFLRNAPAKPRIFFDQNNVMHVDGEKFFPIGLYHVQQEDIKLIADTKFNLVLPLLGISPSLKNWYDECEKYKIKSIAKLGNDFLAPEIDVAKWRSLIADFVNYSQIIAWYLTDEPGAGEYKMLNERYNLIKRIDPERPIYSLECKPFMFSSLIACGDILATDPYPSDGPLTLVADYANALKKACRDKKSMWLVLEAYANQYKPLPTPEALEANTFIALACGARGILYYAFDDTSIKGVSKETKLTNNSVFWNAMKKVAEKLDILKDVLVAEDAINTVTVTPEKGFYSLARKDGDMIYLFVINANPEHKTASVTISGIGNKTAKVLFESRNVSFVNGYITENFARYQTHIYKIAKINTDK